MTIVVPSLEALKKEGQAGQRKITQYTRYGTVFLATFQALGISVALQAQPGLVINPGLMFELNSVVTLVTGTMFLMWLGEKLTDIYGNKNKEMINKGTVNNIVVSWLDSPAWYPIATLFCFC
jgi:preprotein translocase subunit SecY